jgi:GNAT superfamily N-acetyltransferase
LNTATTGNTYTIRVSIPSDTEEIVRVTNLAYAVEQFCIQGLRTDAEDVRSRMKTGQFLVIEDPTEPSSLRGSVFMSITDMRGYLGVLSVEPSFQGNGLAKALITAVEDRCRLAGCKFIDISVVNLRRELFPFYSKLGYAPFAIQPFHCPEKAIQPLHLVQMTKPLLPLVHL